MVLPGWLSDGEGNLRQTWPVPGMDIVGARFRHARLRAGMSQRELATRAGVSQSVVSRFERGMSGGTRTEAVVRLAVSIPGFPFGYCPHNHRCAYSFEPPGDWKLRKIRQRAPNKRPPVTTPRPSWAEIVRKATPGAKVDPEANPDSEP